MHAVRPAPAVLWREHRGKALRLGELHDLVGVGRDQHLRELAALTRGAIHPGQHRLAGQREQHLARQACRAQPRRDHPQHPRRMRREERAGTVGGSMVQARVRRRLGRGINKNRCGQLARLLQEMLLPSLSGASRPHAWRARMRSSVQAARPDRPRAARGAGLIDPALRRLYHRACGVSPMAA